MVKSNSINPVVAGLIVVVFVALVGLFGWKYMNRENSDPVYEEMTRKAQQANSGNAASVPQGSAPQPGSRDYARPAGDTLGVSRPTAPAEPAGP